jgi:hypothetical protein
MSVTDEAVAANQQYAADFKLGHLPMPPARKLGSWLAWMRGLPSSQRWD